MTRTTGNQIWVIPIDIRIIEFFCRKKKVIQPLPHFKDWSLYCVFKIHRSFYFKILLHYVTDAAKWKQNFLLQNVIACKNIEQFFSLSKLQWIWRSKSAWNLLCDFFSRGVGEDILLPMILNVRIKRQTFKGYFSYFTI